jgi:uncharacterized protein (DUF2267 family)
MADPGSSDTRHESHAAASYHAFLHDLEVLSGLPDEQAEEAAVAVLSVLEQRIMADQARHLESELPSKLRDLIIRLPQRRFGRAAFLRRVGDQLGREPHEAEPIVRAVFRAVRQRISEGEAADVAAELPPELAEMWLNP